MWAPKNRKQYDRSHLRYESDLRDAEWAEVAPFIPPAKPGGNKRAIDIRHVTNGAMYILGTAANDGHCRRTYRPKAQCMITWNAGRGTAH